MVGYIIGLGDRHTENIMFHAKTGEVVHVDFNCLFFGGMKLPQPEKVPFRLTQNMVDALGLTGCEGTFKKVCELVLGLLRHHKETLLSVLETFVHDPFVEWTKGSKNTHFDVTKPKNTLKDIEDRLDGKMRHVDNQKKLLLPLSVDGHVQKLIQEATKAESLASMYVGWASYL